MRRFKDNKGREWDIVIDVAQIGTVRSITGVDLYKMIDAGMRGLTDLLQDPCKFVDVLFVLVENQAKVAGVTDIDFGHGFSGDSLERATDAFVEEWIDFFPNPKGRSQLRAIIAKGTDLAKAMAETVEREIEALSPEKAIQMMQNADRISNATSGASPASAESIHPD